MNCQLLDYIQHFPATPDLGVFTDLVLGAMVIEIAVMSSASSAITYTSVYTDSKPGRVFWGADEEISDGGSPRVIVYGYDGLPMQLVAPLSLDYIPGPEDLQILPVPQDKDEREPMLVHAHDPDYVPEPVYPEYIPLEDEHVFPGKEQPLPPIDSPTAESTEDITESNPKVDPKEYEDDKTKDGPVDYPMDGGDDGDDDDGDSSRDDADDEDTDEDEEDEEEHVALADSAIVIPTVEPISSPNGTKPVIPPPSTDISTTGAKINVRLQASISLPIEAEVERLLAMTTPSPSPPISLSPPFTRERLARIASTQALIDVVTAALPSPPLPPLPPSLYIPPPADHKDDILESDEVGYGIRDTWVDLTEAVPEVAPMTIGEMQQAKMEALQETDRRRQEQMVETLRVMRDMRREMSDMQAELLAHQGPQRKARQPGPDARILDHQDAFGDADSHI
ncbi:hypothetical protein Tco_0896190 [Tanacetum coccineum]